jgi:hypothetical protein
MRAARRLGHRPVRLTLAYALAVAGAGLLVAATFVPVNGGGRAGYSEAIYDTSSLQLRLFAIEPLGVAALAVLAVLAALVSRAARRWAAGMLLAFGLQSGLLFAAYFGGAAFGNPEFNSLRAGSALGLIGAVLLVLSGAVTLATRDVS